MTAPDPRLEEIEGRRSSEPCERHDWCAVSDIAYLLAELRKAQDKLARVEGLADRWLRLGGDVGTASRLRLLRAAVADATGGGE